MSKLGIVWIALLLVPKVWPQQHHVDETNSYHRVFAIVPYVGSGTYADPKRPMFAPLPDEMGRGKSGILAYYHEPTDDKKSAVVVFVAADRASLKPILTAAGPGVTVFDRESGHQSQAAVEQALKDVLTDFDWNRFSVRVR
jgi:hypothetical protein